MIENFPKEKTLKTLYKIVKLKIYIFFIPYKYILILIALINLF